MKLLKIRTNDYNIISKLDTCIGTRSNVIIQFFVMAPPVVLAYQLKFNPAELDLWKNIKVNLVILYLL